MMFKRIDHVEIVTDHLDAAPEESETRPVALSTHEWPPRNLVVGGRAGYRPELAHQALCRTGAVAPKLSLLLAALGLNGL
jgi:hypothetical protein